MLCLLSPAKSLDLDSPLTTTLHTEPRLLTQTAALAERLRSLSAGQLRELMGISNELAELNARRYADFTLPQPGTARPAVLTFDGDVYRGLRARERFCEADLEQAQQTLRILSGLYGLLRPLDRIQPYRLEMGTRLTTDQGRGLYPFWSESVSELLAADLEASPGEPVVVNLASTEYARVVDTARLPGRVVSPRFEDPDRSGRYRVVSFLAKRARGEMAAWLVQQRVESTDRLRDFATAGYRYHPDSSTPEVPVFRRQADPAG